MNILIVSGKGNKSGKTLKRMYVSGKPNKGLNEEDEKRELNPRDFK